jgi:ABC-type sulfate/molybdate transport systems ATPase subunit
MSAIAREEAVVLELALDSRRESFHLQLEFRLASAWTVVFGPSGAGKSTLLRLLAGLDRPGAGRIVFNGETLTDTAQGIHLPPGRRSISLVAQQPALFPHLNVARNVAYGLSGLESSARDSRVQAVLELVDATSLARRRPRDLSGGESQRIALARALAPMPGLLLLDEPFSALDGSASDALLWRLQAWVREHNVQTVLATHDAASAYATSAEVVLVREGRLVAIGPAVEALAQERQRIIGRLQGE